MNVEVELPDLGLDGGDEATVVEWHFEEGDTVEEDDILLDVESEAGTVEIPAPCSGVLIERAVDEDETVRVGELLAIIEARDEDLEELEEDLL